ncbi:JAB domain-containing protein [Pedobacter psychroterrae]|uniref:DNA repair protein n=1 Tax=Pedobacter psychroterrae TaxID=2530453 RepID=A0A4R0NJA3_9SPHI|nr:JAB domain-containing protein [Pedobacter psychroterrae]TCC98964.1 DNA repair protein [Pedobacter psychroterrae]
MEQNLNKVAEIELTYKPNYRITDRPKISSSKETYQLLMNYWEVGRLEFLEEFKIILLNRRNRTLGIINLSMGGFAGVVVDSKVIFAAALTACASGIVLAHNHPSGEVEPSHQDIELTKRLVAGGKILDIAVLDHLIISNDRYYSFSDVGLL